MLDSGTVGSSGEAGKGNSQIVTFGTFLLDLRSGELRRNGHKVKLQDQPFQVLAQLLEKPGDVVTREELRTRLWPVDTFVDFDHSLNAAIRRLRDALGDTAENPRFVETVARRGYRFLVPVAGTPGNSSGSIPIATPDPVRAFVLRFAYWIAAGAAVLLILVGVKLGLLLERIHTPKQFRISQLTANPEDDGVRAAAISSDGKYLAFADEIGFYIRQIDTGETHSVALPPELKAMSLSWFPDNVHIIVALSAQGEPSGLWELSTIGGDPRKLIEEGTSPAVSPRGDEIAYITGSKLNEEVWLAQADGGQPRKVTGNAGDLFGALAWSPDGTKLAYSRGKLVYGYGVNAASEVLEIHSRSAGGAPVQLSKWSVKGLDGPMVWATDGQLIYTCAEQPPNLPGSNLWSVKVNNQGQRTNEPVRLTSDNGSVLSVSVTADGRRIAYLKGIPDPDVYVAKLKGRDLIGEPQRLTFDNRKDIPYDWTPDGKSVVFTSDRTGILSIYKQSSSQTVPDLLVRNSHPLIESRLSPDGTQLLYVEYPSWAETNFRTPLMRAPLAGGAPTQILAENLISNHQCARAPAATCIYSALSGRLLTFFNFDVFKGKGRQVLQIEDDVPELYNWSLSPDGKTLAITKAKSEDKKRIRLVFLNGAPERWITIHSGPGLGSLDWAADSKSLWSGSAGDEGNSLLNIDLEGYVRVVWQPKRKSVGWGIPSRDGKSLALYVESTTANAWMLETPIK